MSWWLMAVLLIHISDFAWSQEQDNMYTIVPTQCSSCNGQTLDHYLQDDGGDTYFTSNTMFVFQPGVHELNQIMAISDVDNLILMSSGEANISCSEGVGMSFINITHLEIQGLTFIGCGMAVEVTESINHYGATFLNISTASVGVFFNHITHLHIDSMKVFNGSGYGVFAINVLGNSTVSNSVFAFNNYECIESRITQCMHNIKGGNFILLYVDHKTCPEEPEQHTLLFASTRFHHGIDIVEDGTFQARRSNSKLDDIQYIGGGGLGIIKTQSSYGVDITIQDSCIDQNAAYVGANLYLSVFDFVDNSSISIHNSKILMANYVDDEIRSRSSTYGGGLCYLYGHLPRDKHIPVCPSVSVVHYQRNYLTIADTDVSFNDARYGGAALIFLWPKSLLSQERAIIVNNSNFTSNNGRRIVAIVNPSYSIADPPFAVYFHNINFYNNSKSFAANNMDTLLENVIFLIAVKWFDLKGCRFEHNSATAIQSQQSRIYFHDNNTFINNTGENGGALNLNDGSFMYLHENSTVLFDSNHAKQLGGAIFATSKFKCFFQPIYSELYGSVSQRLVFTNNTALSGSAIYGTVDNCTLEVASDRKSALEMFMMIAEINITVDPHPVSGSSSKVCWCSMDSPDKCSNHSLAHFPGETFTLSVAAVGHESGPYGYGLTPATIHTEITTSSTTDQLGNHQQSQSINGSCSNLTYTIYSNQSAVNLSLHPSVDNIYTSTSIMIELKKCPMGFILSPTHPYQCQCQPILARVTGVSCNITNNTITKPNQVWVGVVRKSHQDTLATGSCPFNHCVPGKQPLYLQSPDTQCADYYTGVLCTSCADNYSIALGSDKCLKCTNNYLSLLIVFLIGGVLLIILLAVSNLTVSTGKINGLLFYANIIKVTGGELFAFQASHFLPFSIFINWLNLDFGIESCFFDGFTVYMKAWFQYLFPLYLFVLMGLTIFAARYSRIARIIPSNIVPVFATIVIMASTKLLRNAVTVLPHATLSTPNGIDNVWQLDGALDYFGVEHAFLVIFSSIILIFIFLYSLLLLFHTVLQSIDSSCINRPLICVKHQLFKIMPLFDSYDAPYNKKTRYWTGLLMMIRIVVFAMACYHTDINRDMIGVLVSIFVILTSVALVGIICLFKIYKKLRLRILEISSIMNLAILQVILMIFKDRRTDTTVVIVASISISFEFFILVGTAIREIYKKFERRSPKLQAKSMQADIWIQKKWNSSLQKTFKRHDDSFYRYESHYHYINENGSIEMSGTAITRSSVALADIEEED